MATTKTSASGTEKNGFDSKSKVNYAKAEESIKMLKDATQSYAKTISTFDKDTLRSYLRNISSNEKNLRNISRFLFYRSHIYYRLVRFYASMPELGIRQVVPKYDLGSTPNDSTFLKDYDKNLSLLDKINIQSHSESIWERCLVDDVCYGLYYINDNGSYIYILDPDSCKIIGTWETDTFAYAVDMTTWRSKAKQSELESLGDPLLSAYKAYESSGDKWQTINISDDCYPFCFKFRTDDVNTVIPPLLTLFLSYINLADEEEYQAIAAEQQIFKLIYLPMKVLQGTKESDDFQITPDILLRYMQKMLDEAIPANVAGAVIPGDELGVIDFSNNAANDTNQLQNAQNQILDISGAGMLLNTSKITTQAGFKAALKMETEFALSSMIPQIDGFVNLILQDKLGDKKACRVKHFEVSTYTKEDLAEQLLKSAQYSFSNRLAYNTCLGVSEKTTLTMEYLENTVLGLHTMMNHPLSSSFTTSGNNDEYTTEVGQGRPSVDDDKLSDDGSRTRDQANS